MDKFAAICTSALGVLVLWLSTNPKTMISGQADWGDTYAVVMRMLTAFGGSAFIFLGCKFWYDSRMITKSETK